ncbi:hypothetical protein RJT34_31142 [Clitoria ternatea]|uniref:Zinc finger CCCH domain-containing protein 13 n=1 Tax=Clitoria ternatea TaxID=43366 RepID=A0AAN9EY48_CLITE
MGGSITIHYYVSLVIPVNGRRDYLGNDLRDKLDRRHLSPRRYSPTRDTRGRQTIHEYSPSRSLEKKSDKRHRRHQGVTGQSDNSGSLRVSDRIQDRVKEGKLLSSSSRDTLEEQLKNINTLENRKFQLSVYLDESVQEVDSLNSSIEELEVQLCKEDEECKRITSRIRKFIRVHSHISQLQDELKRSQVRLQRFGDQLVSDIPRIGTNEEDLSIDIVSNGENTGIVKHNLEHNDASSHRKRPHIEQNALEELKQDRSREGHLVEPARTRKRSRWNLSDQLNDNCNEALEAPDNGTNVNKSLDLEGRHKRGLKESRIEVPSTSMAAHVVDEEVEIELDDRADLNEPPNRENENGMPPKVKGAPLMLPPALIPRSNYSQYEGKDESVDVDGLDEEPAGAHVDIS